MTTPEPATGPGRRSLLTLLPALVAVTLIAAVCGLLTGYKVDLSGPTVSPRAITFANAQTGVLIDRRDSVLGSGARPRGAAPQNTLQTLTSRAQVFASLAAAPSGRESIGRRIGLDGSQVAVQQQFTAAIPRAATDARDQERAAQLLDDRTEVALLLRVDPDSPIVRVYARAPTAGQARAAADAAVAFIGATAVRAATSQRKGAEAFASSIVTRPLGPATGAMVSPNASPQAAVLVGLAVFGVGAALVLRLRRRPAGGPRGGGGVGSSGAAATSADAAAPMPRRPIDGILVRQASRASVPAGRHGNASVAPTGSDPVRRSVPSGDSTLRDAGRPADDVTGHVSRPSTAAHLRRPASEGPS